MPKFTIERIKAEDWQRYRELRLKALLEEPTAFSSIFEEERALPDDDWIQKVSKFAMSEKERVFVARDGDDLVGMMGVVFDPSVKRVHVACIVGVFVPKALRGYGISKQLMQTVLEETRRVEYIRKVKLTVMADQEAARSLYKSFGFREVGRMVRDFKIGDEFKDVIMMEMWLAQEEKRLPNQKKDKRLSSNITTDETDTITNQQRGSGWLKSLMAKLRLKS